MSYDLYFTSPKISLEEFNAYFLGRLFYTVNNGQAMYTNEDTGVYFSFEHNDQSEVADDEDLAYSVAFNLNYYRPHYFALEAEPEVSKFIRAFNCSIQDDQNDGMADGPYSREGFLRGWNHGNEFGYRAILQQDDAPSDIYTKPTKELEDIWRWNHAKGSRQELLGEDIFVPQIIFITVDGKAASTCVWPDAIPSLIPSVDFVYVRRIELAPKGWFTKTQEDYCLVPRKDYIGALRPYYTNEFGMDAFKLPEPYSPKELKDFVTGLDPRAGKVQGIGKDVVINFELADKYNS